MEVRGSSYSMIVLNSIVLFASLFTTFCLLRDCKRMGIGRGRPVLDSILYFPSDIGKALENRGEK